MVWQPIDIAPKDGTEIIGLGLKPKPQIGYNGHTPDVRIIKMVYGGFWRAKNDYGNFTVGFVPTHWIPFPEHSNVK